ncbi:LexA family protein [Tepidibacter mesophilus]|uniref:LexA family protein n=1 Tax=Tepidibacter mesophilus TaxID=655607 RepID=UPI000C07B20B|nr:winged helix-turn-helix transcriptional regulator [Tepidibacter mesophilus]
MDSKTQILYEMYKYMQKNEYSPTVRDLCELVGLKSPSTVHSHIQKLKKEGYLCQEPTLPRTLILTEKALKLLGLEKNTQKSSDFINLDHKILLAAKFCLKENNFTFLKEFENIINKVKKQLY